MDENELHYWDLPQSSIRYYQQHGFSKLFSWQKECLKLPGVTDGRNLVYSAPTGSGKSFIVEILMFKRLQKRKGKVILVLPYISVAREKLFQLRELFALTGFVVDGYMGSSSPASGFQSVDIAVCTIEKANNLLNKLIQEKDIEKLSMFVVDELHMLGDESRGYLIELMLSKLRYLMSGKMSSKEHTDVDIQIVGFSASIPNLNILSMWLNAVSYETNYRPVTLDQFIKIGSKICDQSLVPLRAFQPVHVFKDDDCGVTSLCYETVEQGQSVLVFCPTKNWCERLAFMIARNIAQNKSTAEKVNNEKLKVHQQQILNILNQLKQLPTGLDKVLSETLFTRVAFHHAGLTLEEREIIETGFRKGFITVLVATSTLSSGVNLPAARVIIRTPVFHGKVLDARSYQQMAGRAGRKGQDDKGECYLLCEERERQQCHVLMSSTLPEIQSNLLSYHNHAKETPASLKKAVLEVVAAGLASTTTDVQSFLACTLNSVMHGHKPSLLATLDGADQEAAEDETSDVCIKWLEDHEFIRLQRDKSSTLIHATQLGRAALASSLPAAHALNILADLQAATKALALDTELHLIYLVTPVSSFQDWKSLNWFGYLHILGTLSTSNTRVSQLVGVEESFIIRMSACGMNNRMNLSEKRSRLISIHTRFYAALMLHDLVQELPLPDVCRKYSCCRGMVQSLQQSAASFAGMVTTFCQNLGWWSLEVLLREFQARLTFGVQRDLLDLTRIVLLNKERARALYSAGLTSCDIVAKTSPKNIELILRNSIKFQSKKKDMRENEWEVKDRMRKLVIKVPGQLEVVTLEQAAVMIVKEARAVSNITIQPEHPVSESFVVSEGLELKTQQHIAIDEVHQGMAKLSINSPKDTAPSCGSMNEDSSLETSFDMFGLMNNEEKKDSTTLCETHETLKGCGEISQPVEQGQHLAQQTPLTTSADLQEAGSVPSATHLDELSWNTFMEECLKQKCFAISVAGGKPRSNIKAEDTKAKLTSNLHNLSGISICWSPTELYFISLVDGESTDNKVERRLMFVKQLFENLAKDTIVIAWDIKKVAFLLEVSLGICLKYRWQDPYIAAWVLDSDNNHDLEHMVYDNLNDGTYLNRCRDVFNANSSTVEKVKKETSSRALIAFLSMKKLKPQLFKLNMWDFFIEIEMPHVSSLSLLEINGIHIDLALVRRNKELLGQILTELQGRAWSAVGYKFNLHNPSEIAKILYERLGLNPFESSNKHQASKSGKPTSSTVGTNKEILDTLSKQKDPHPLPGIIMQWRSVSHSLNKVIFPLLSSSFSWHDGAPLHHPHTTTCTSSGRICMQEPNIQNIPNPYKVALPTTTGEEPSGSGPERIYSINLRDVFVAQSGNIFVSADYSQLELRMLAHLSRDEMLLNLFNNITSTDVFCAMAADLAKDDKKPDDISKDERQLAKQACYGVLYGMTAKSLSTKLGLSEGESRLFMDNFLSRFPVMKSYLHQIPKDCHAKGYIETVCGRRRYLPDIESKNPKKRSHAERQSINGTVQGSAADLMKAATCKIQNEVEKRRWSTDRVNPATNVKCYLVHNIHDELLYEVSRNDVTVVTQVIRDCMMHALPLTVKLDVKLRVGPTWGRLEPYHVL